MQIAQQNVFRIISPPSESNRVGGGFSPPSSHTTVRTVPYRHKKSRRMRTMGLDVMEFIHRFLQHVLPTGFMKVRHYGFLNPNCGMSLEEARGKIELAYGFEVKTPEPAALPEVKPSCRDCGSPLRYLFFILPERRARGSSG